MTPIEIALAVAVIVLFCLYGYLAAYAERVKRNVDELESKLNLNWREHKDDYYAVQGKHHMLVKALGMKEVPGESAKYVKDE